MAATATQRLTYQDLIDLPQERPGDRHELIDGELFVSAQPTPKHQRVCTIAARKLDEVVVANDLGVTYGSAVDVVFTPETTLAPDICFVSKERLPIVGRTFVHAAPDLIIEVLSPSTRGRDQGAKQAVYARFGVREYWLLDPIAPAVAGYRLDGDRFVPLPVGDDGRVASLVVPGFALGPDDLKN